MTEPTDFEIFLVTHPGLESTLRDELVEKRFSAPKIEAGGVAIRGDWPDVWRANLEIRGASKVLARISQFRVVHLSQLDKLSRRFDWASILRETVPVRVQATCKGSKIYHAKAAAQRIETAIHEMLGAPIDPDAELTIRARIDDNICTLSINTSGELLHKRGHKSAVAKAPMRENLAALFLRQMGYDGTQTVLDPMCGSGTFVIEAAEIAAGLAPGRSRDFAFELLANFDDKAWQTLSAPREPTETAVRFYGSDRNAAAIDMSQTNAQRAGIDSLAQFTRQQVKDLGPPEGSPGIVIINPPYGARIGSKKQLHEVYSAIGQTLMSRFVGWRVGIITTGNSLARVTGLPFRKPGPVIDHGGISIRLFSTGPLGDGTTQRTGHRRRGRRRSAG